MKRDFRYIYGPVPSWRLGSSLGIDPISKAIKICTFNCVYCQIGVTEHFTNRREEFIPVSGIIQEMSFLPALTLDYVTFSGAGEPTLAKNLGKMIRAVKEIREEKVAVITNSSLMNRRDVRKDLALADLVVVKLDACSADLFKRINKPIKTIVFETVVNGIKDFKSNFTGKMALQIMFINHNKEYAREIAQIAMEINPDEVQINTPLRRCRVKPLSREELKEIQVYFDNQNVISVYEASKKTVKSLSGGDTLKRRGKR